MAADLVIPIVVALGCAAVGGPEVLRMLLDRSGRSAIDDAAICVFVVCGVTAPVLGTILLNRYFRLARRANGVGAAAAARPAPGEDQLTRVTVAVALAVILFVTACLLFVPSCNGAA